MDGGIYLPDVLERLHAAAQYGRVEEVERLLEQVRVHARFRQACIRDIERIRENARA